MKFKSTKLAIGALALASIACGNLEESSSKLQDSSESHVVCSPSDVPSNWVVTRVSWTHECGGGPFQPSTYRIRKPSDGMSVCDVAPVPAGYLKNGGGYYTSACERTGDDIFSKNTYKITKL